MRSGGPGRGAGRLAAEAAVGASALPARTHHAVLVPRLVEARERHSSADWHQPPPCACSTHCLAVGAPRRIK